MLRVFFGHHKCATLWINKLLIRVTNELGYKYFCCALPDEYDFELKAYLEREKPDLLFQTTSSVDDIPLMPENYRGVHIVRDPRDLAVSSYFSHRNSHPVTYFPELAAHREKLKQLSLDDGIMLDIKFLSNVVCRGFNVPTYDTICHWNPDLEKVLEVKFEDLVQNPNVVFLNILRWWEILDDSPITLKRLATHIVKRGSIRLYQNRSFPFRIDHKLPYWKALAILYDLRFEVMTGGRKRGEENVNHHYRSGIPGDWKNYLSDRHKNYFKERYGKFFIERGYEKNNDW